MNKASAKSLLSSLGMLGDMMSLPEFNGSMTECHKCCRLKLKDEMICLDLGHFDMYWFCKDCQGNKR